MKNIGFERAMNGPARWLVSVIGVSAAFVAGRFVASAISRMREEQLNDEVRLETPANESIAINAEPEQVYAIARRFDYFKQFLFGIDGIELRNPSQVRLLVAESGHDYALDLEVIADQPGEFFGLRVEHDGKLYGTFLVRCEPAVGAHHGTVVSVATRYKIELPVALMNEIKPVVAREIDVYLGHLKEKCEEQMPAQVT